MDSRETDFWSCYKHSKYLCNTCGWTQPCPRGKFCGLEKIPNNAKFLERIKDMIEKGPEDSVIGIKEYVMQYTRE